MVAIFNEYPEQKQYISEISFLEFKNNNFECFELTLNSKIEKEQGNRISYYVNRYLLPLAAITYQAGLFYVLHLLNNGKIEDKEEWQEIIEQALEELDLGDIHVQVKIIKIDRLTPEIQTELAVRIIQKENLKRSLVSSKNNIEISRVTNIGQKQ